MIKPNRVLSISNVKQLCRWWPFLQEGLRYFQGELGWEIDDKTYLSTLSHIVHNGDGRGLLLVHVSGAGNPMGYIAVTDNTIRFYPKTCHVYALYTNSKCPSTVAELAADAQAWAKGNGYVEVQACSFRTSGASIRWFEKMGFKRKFLVFSRKLV